MLNINTNLSSLIAQNSLNQSTNKLNTAIERMSTGCKINHAKDNAANYSISTNMTTKIGAYQVAEDNALQGLDMINTASESLTLIEDKLMRLRALAEQSANGTYGAQSKQAINQEANAIVDEIERLYNTTEYNGINLAKGKVIGTEESKFIKDVDRRDTSEMTTLASVAIDEALTSGTYSISTADELAKLATMTNNGLVGADCEFVLGADIDLNGYSNWTPIGNYTMNFNGIFDGNGYTISNLSITNSTSNGNGLFGGVANSEIKNLSVENANITINSVLTKYDAIVVGYTAGKVNLENIYASGVINTGNLGEYVGGVLGIANGNVIIDSCSSNAEILGRIYVGGIAGRIGNNTGVFNSVSKSTMTGEANLGGIAGEANRGFNFINCYSESIINVTGSGSAGGLVGTAYNGLIESSYSNSTITSSNNGTGGLVGRVYSGALVISKSSVLKDSPSLKGIYVGQLSTSGTSPSVELLNNSYDSTISSTNKMLGNLSASNASSYFESGTTTNCPALEDLGFNEAGMIKIYEGVFTLQVGTTSDTLSEVKFNNSFSLNGISTLRNIGKRSGDYLTQLDKMLSQVSEKQTEFGAVQNRLESVVEEIGIQYDNLVSSRSTLRDADIAEVSAEYIQQQILQQASATLLATANQSPSIALQLI